MLVAFLGLSGALIPIASGSVRSNMKASPSFVSLFVATAKVGSFVKNWISLTSSGEMFSSNSSLIYFGFSAVASILYTSLLFSVHVLSHVTPSPMLIFFQIWFIPVITYAYSSCLLA